MLPNKNAVDFCAIFSDIGQCFRPAQTKSLENQKSVKFEFLKTCRKHAK